MFDIAAGCMAADVADTIVAAAVAVVVVVAQTCGADYLPVPDLDQEVGLAADCCLHPQMRMRRCWSTGTAAAVAVAADIDPAAAAAAADVVMMMFQGTICLQDHPLHKTTFCSCDAETASKGYKMPSIQPRCFLLPLRMELQVWRDKWLLLHGCSEGLQSNNYSP